MPSTRDTRHADSARQAVRHIQLPDTDERIIGALLMHFMLETIMTAALMGIDALTSRRLKTARKRRCNICSIWRHKMAIRRLDEGTINRIAAGEVVERPASAVKELVENAIDAGAKRIDVTLENGGKSLIRVEDDGCGMSPADLACRLSAMPHRNCPTGMRATIFPHHLAGLSRRALPSIGAVSKMTITTRTADASEASTLTVAGGVRATCVRRPAQAARALKSETCFMQRRRALNF